MRRRLLRRRVAHYVSTNLSIWEEVEPALIPGAAGWQPNAYARSATRFESTRVSHHCSANWPKPPTCAADPWSVRADAAYHPNYPSPLAAAPLRIVYGGLVEVVHNYKSGGSSLAGPHHAMLQPGDS